MSKKQYEKPTKKQADADAKQILENLPDEKWKQFFNKKFPDLANHLAADHSHIAENPSRFAVSITEQETGAHLKSMRARPGLYGGMMTTDDPENPTIFAPPPKIGDAFRKSQKEKLDFGFGSIFWIVDGIPKLNKTLAKFGYEFCILDYCTGIKKIWFWIERTDTDYYIPLSGKFSDDVVV